MILYQFFPDGVVGMRSCGRGGQAQGKKADLKSVIITIRRNNNKYSSSSNLKKNRLKMVCPQSLIHSKRMQSDISAQDKTRKNSPARQLRQTSNSGAIKNDTLIATGQKALAAMTYTVEH